MKSKNIIFFGILLFVVAQVAAVSPILEIDLGIKKDGTILFDSTKITFGAESMILHEEGQYSVVISDINGKPLFVSLYDLSPFIYSDPPKEVDYVLLNEKILYKPEMYKLEIFRTDKLVYSRFLEFCNNNGECDIDENYLTCPGDCPFGARDRICINEADGSCDPDCIKNADPDCRKRSKLWIFVLAAIIVFALAAVIFWRKKGLLPLLAEAIERFKYSQTRLKNINKGV